MCHNILLECEHVRVDDVIIQNQIGASPGFFFLALLFLSVFAVVVCVAAYLLNDCPEFYKICIHCHEWPLISIQLN